MDDAPNVDVTPTERWDRSKWISVFSSHSPTIREVTECLGLGLSPSASTTNRGIPKFDAPEFKQLSQEVTRISKDLPMERDKLLDVAAESSDLEEALDTLLESLGPQIWGRGADRTRLLKPDPEKKTYIRDLYYEDPEDREIIKTQLHRWIIIKACYSIRNKKLKKSSTGGEGLELDPNPELEVDAQMQKPQLMLETQVPSAPGPLNLSGSQSPLTTPPSGVVSPHSKFDSTTPPTEGGAQQPHVLKKRKSSAFATLSDEEGSQAPSIGARKRSYQSTTLPIQRKSPRKALAARPSPENTPIIGASHHLQTPAATRNSPTPTSVSEPARPYHSPKLNSIPNAPARSSNATPTTFTAVNHPTPSSGNPNAGPGAAAITAPSGSFAAINTLGTAAPAPRRTRTQQNVPVASVAEVTHTTFAPVNAPSGFTAVNASGSHNVPIAPNPNSYASPYNPSDHARPPPDNRAHINYNDAPAHRGPMAEHEPTPQKEASVYNGQSHQRPENAYTPDQHMPPHLAMGPKASHTSQQAFHNHSIPTASGISNFQAKQHAVPLTHPVQHTNALTNVQIVPSNTTPIRQPVVQNQMLESEAHRPSPKEVIDTAMTLRQCQLLSLLMGFLFPRAGQRVEESVLLRELEYIFVHNEPVFRAQLGTLYEFYARTLFSWIEERYKAMQLRCAATEKPGIRPTEMVDRLLALNDLRIMRMKWKHLDQVQDGGEVLSPEDLLCRTFAMMTKTQGTETVFKEGLQNLNDDAFDFFKNDDLSIRITSER